MKYVDLSIPIINAEEAVFNPPLTFLKGGMPPSGMIYEVI